MNQDPRSGEPAGPSEPAFFRWLLQLVEEGTLDASGPVGAGLVRRLEGAAMALELSADARPPVSVVVEHDTTGRSVRLRRADRVVTIATGLDESRAAELYEQLVGLLDR